MKAVSVKSYTSEVNAVEVVETTRPIVKSHQVLVKVHAAGGNAADVYVMAGLMMKAGWKLTFPFIPGYEFSGVIEELGDQVTSFQIGDEVFGLNFGRASQDSGEGDTMAACFAEYVAVSWKKVSRKPKEISFEVAAGLSLVGTAAYQAVHLCGKIAEGSRVLILGGSTTVGAMAIQMCKNCRAFVAVTCSSRSINFVAQFRPDVIVPYDSEKWYAHPQCEHFDFIMDIAGATSTLEILKSSDHLVAVGAAFVSMVNPSVGVSAQSHPPFSYARFFCIHQNTTHQDLVARWVVEGKIQVPIAATHSLDRPSVIHMLQEIKAAHSHGKHIIKMI
eukprot:gene6326-6976_t